MSGEKEINVIVNLDKGILKQFISDFITGLYIEIPDFNVNIHDTAKLLLWFCEYIDNNHINHEFRSEG